MLQKTEQAGEKKERKKKKNTNKARTDAGSLVAIPLAAERNESAMCSHLV